MLTQQEQRLLNENRAKLEQIVDDMEEVFISMEDNMQVLSSLRNDDVVRGIEISKELSSQIDMFDSLIRKLQGVTAEINFLTAKEVTG